MTLLTILQLVAGIAILLGAADLVLRGALRLSALFGISPLVVGLTVVAVGTSAPEIAVVVFAGLKDASDIALGNLVGSNIFNILFILGLSAIIAPIVVAQQIVRIDVPILIGLSGAVAVVALDGVISGIDGIILISLAVAYTLLAAWLSRRESIEIVTEYEEHFKEEIDRSGKAYFIAGLLLLIGIGGLMLGSHWTVEGAQTIAAALGLSELFIGLTVVALGTSLPEVVTSILAAMKNQQDIAVGNIIGSSIYNISAVLGIAVLTAGELTVAPHVLTFDIPLLVATAVVCLPIFFTGYKISRWEGGVFFFYYAAYLAFLILDAMGHEALHMFRWAMLGFVIPLTALTIAVITTRHLTTYRRRAAKSSS